MLDENLPTFHFKPSSDNPLTNVVYFTQHGDEPAPEYLFKRADPAQPASRNKYAAALADPYSPDVIYAECVVEPEWTQPTLSSAELRAQAQNPNPVPAVPTVPDGFTLQLYNPDQTISFKMSPGSWNRTESWEFEMPTHSFRLPTTSEVDRQQIASPAADLTPKIMFRWKKDGRLSKDMTCYMTGKSVGGRKSKEPDITVALFKQARDSALTIYEPNLKRVEVEDRKGLDIVLALSSEVIKDLYLVQRHDVFNISGTPPADKRKNSRPLIGVAPSPPTAMSGAIGAAPSTTQAQAIPSQPPHGNTAMPPSPAAAASSAAIDAETRRLQAMVEKEEREREMRDRAEQKRIKKMLEDEERERRRREAEVAKETERLRKKYGVEGQDLPSSASSSRPHGSPPLPPRSQQQPQQLSPHPGGGGWFGQHAPPPRPVSAGPAPAPGPFNNPTLNSWWGGPTAPAPVLYPPTQPTPQGGSPGHGRRRTGGGSGSVPNTHNPTTSVSQFFHLNRSENSNDRQKIQKKRSMQW